MMLFAMFLAASWVGNESCRPCHAAIVEKYSKTPMARSSGPVTATPPGTFTHGATTYRITPVGRIVFGKNERKVDWYIGSGAAGQSFAYAFNGYLFLAPITWYSQRRSWDSSPGYEHDTAPRWNRPVDSNCLFCHASQTRPIYGTQNRFATPAIAQGGVGCERCHGPASEHVASGGRILPVNPARLDPVRRDSICSQCHLSGEARINREGKSIAMYRAGERLSDYVSVFVAPEGNPAVRATGYVEKLEQSACKRSSGEKLWCGTCHDPHDVPEPKLAASWFRSKCLTCHTTNQCDRGPDCRSCHMPRARASDGGHGVLTDHSIPRRPPMAGNKQRTDHPDSLIAFRDFKPGARELGLAWAEVGDLSKAISLLAGVRNLDAEAKSRLADLYSRAGDHVRALALYREVYASGVQTPLVLINLGALEAETGNLNVAEALWMSALKQNPGLLEAAVNLSKLDRVRKRPEVDTAYRIAVGALP